MSFDNEIQPIALASAHPRQFSDQPEFIEAVGLLQDRNVPLKTVTQYALGGSLVLSCVGLAALARRPWRPDRAEALDDVTAFFGSLAPLAMHFALQYFLTLEPRPPVGAPISRRRGLVAREPLHSVDLS